MNLEPSKPMHAEQDGATDLANKGAMRRVNWQKVAISLVAAALLFVISLFEILKLPDLLLYDWLVYHSYTRPQTNHVVLIEVANQQLSVISKTCS